MCPSPPVVVPALSVSKADTAYDLLLPVSRFQSVRKSNDGHPVA